MAHTNTHREPPHISSSNSLKATQLNRNELRLLLYNQILSAVPYGNRHNTLWLKKILSRAYRVGCERGRAEKEMGRSRFLCASASNNEEHPEADSMPVERSSGYVKKSAMAECESSVIHTTQAKKKRMSDTIFDE
ncbi:hypothetical protein CEXT_129071 [Caerostris extrusa]|uniref:Uncharacterized protein n=1 Tax=Caerostris extrusa TaxID=172846 RepID=A0AAV4NXA5_CAEEX|nr:hypothetical protein CEXT_129071 [Caerostris extrusa]